MKGSVPTANSPSICKSYYTRIRGVLVERDYLIRLRLDGSTGGGCSSAVLAAADDVQLILLPCFCCCGKHGRGVVGSCRFADSAHGGDVRGGMHQEGRRSGEGGVRGSRSARPEIALQAFRVLPHHGLRVRSSAIIVPVYATLRDVGHCDGCIVRGVTEGSTSGSAGWGATRGSNRD